MTPVGAPFTLPQIAQLLSSGEVPLEQYLEFCLGNVDDLDGNVKALLDEPQRRERIFAEAAALQKRFPDPSKRPPLFGILVGVKDLFRVDGFETRAGSRLPPSLFEGQQAAIVTALQKLGALVLGKTVTTEFAFMEPGPTCNPHHLLHTPGGSSSGSAAAVACSYCSLAMGTQTIGSLSRPASYCGVVGFKPSYEGISRRGVIPFSASADHIGFFTHNVSGARFVAALLVKDFFAETNMADCSRKPVLGIPEGPYLEQVEPDGRAHFEETIQKLVRAGFQVKRIPLFTNIAEIDKIHRAMIVAELAKVHREWFAVHRDLYRPGTLAAIEAGLSVSARELAQAKEHRFVVRHDIQNAMSKNAVDLWLSPSALNVAPEGISHTGSPAMSLPWTHAGVPTLSLPSGSSQRGLPFGLQMAASFGHDALLLAWAESIERAIGLG